MKEKLFICTSKDILDTLHFINNLVLRKEKDTVYITLGKISEFSKSRKNSLQSWTKYLEQSHAKKPIHLLDLLQLN